MNPDELKKTLQAAKVPERSGEYWNDFPQQVVRQLGRQTAVCPPAPRRNWWGWAVAGATACVLAGFMLGHWRGRTETETVASRNILQDAKLIREMMATFPNRVRALVQDEQGLRVELSETDDVPLSPPLWVKICDGEHCVSLVTFSGQELQVGGQKVTILSDAQGGVIVVGDRFLWSSDLTQNAGKPMRIEAKELSSAGAA